ncbi:MAG TPA: cyclodeaminase/cyclohydrolase family protein [Solirubrobacteraceae bacterium]|nr:cyclodeaminase/cyclohydrolase family protein [Solirubrobacteraceae bacterium]
MAERLRRRRAPARSRRRLCDADAIGGLADTSSWTELLERVASSEPVPGAGPAAAWTCALCAALVEMVCGVMLRREADEDGARSARRARASAIRVSALALAERDIDAYRDVLAARRQGTAQLRHDALSAAADPPLAIAETAAEVVALAADSFADARGGVRGEAAVAAVLAEGVVRAAAAIVEFNLAGEPNDPRRARARELAEAARAECGRVAGG